MIRKLSIALILLVIIGLLPLPAYAQEAPSSEASTPTDSTSTDQATSPAIDPVSPVNDPAVTPQPEAEEATTEEKASRGDISEEDQKASDNPNSPQSVTTNPDPTVATSSLVSKAKLPETDKSTGALVYSYPFSAPPGRNGSKPDLAISYNSQNNEEGSIFGYGWSSNIPYIERINKKGTDQLYTQNYFSSSLDGELVSTGTTTYRSKIEGGQFDSYSFSNNQWLVKDKSGTQYKFGYSAGSRQDDSANTSHAYKWMLEEVRDTNNNYIKYEYFKDNGQIYPSRIVYSGNGVTDGIFEIYFDRSSRPDAMISFKSAFQVTTSYRISAIRVLVSGQETHRYTLAYTEGDNGARSLLSSVTETGIDEVTGLSITKPATQFNYTVNNPTWNQSLDWVYFKNPLWGGPYQVEDVTGDAFPDFIYSQSNPNIPSAINTIYKNNAPGQFDPISSQTPTFFQITQLCSGSGQGVDQGIAVVDFNGDHYNDILQAVSLEDNNGNQTGTIFKGYQFQPLTGTWQENPAWASQLYLNRTCFSGGQGSVSYVADFNGDSLPDVYRDQPNLNPHHVGLQMNTGSSFANPITAWATPTDGLPKHDDQMLDLNNDGLADSFQYAVEGTTYNEFTYLNKGTGSWFNSAALKTPIHWYTQSSYNPTGGFVMDVNNDGLLDVVQGRTPLYSNQTVFINQGNGWQQRAWPFPGFDNFYYYFDINPVDINADGLLDLMPSNNYPGGGRGDGSVSFFINAGTVPDLLKTITTDIGGTVDVTYQSSANYVKPDGSKANPNLPFIAQTVKTITTNSGSGASNTINYYYEGGSYYFNNALDRKLAGFAKVIQTDAAGNSTTTFYHQGNSTDSAHGEYNDESWKIGRVYRTEVANSSGLLYQKSINKWDSFDLGNGSKFVKLAQTLNQTFDGDSSHKDKAESYVYDNTNGNLTQKTEYGEVTGSDDGTFTDTGTDKFTTSINYASNTGANILGLPSQETTLDQSSNKVKETKHYYDLQALGSITKGNETKTEQWKTGSTYINTQKTYNSTYGLLTVDTNPLGKTTQYSYDAFNLYPTTITNALSQATQVTYDYSSGKIKQTTDPNNNTFQNVYDGLDRLILVKQPDITTPSTLVTKTAYTYVDTVGSISVKQSAYLDASTIADTYSYFDGLGRLIQTRQEAEGANFSVSDIIYNNLGQVDKESLPYFSVGSAKTSPTATANLYTTYTYDPLQRVISVSNSIGTTSTSYNDWKQTITNPLGKTKDAYADAYGNLVQVDEHNNGNTYSTYYTYNYLNNLTKITDALGNIRNFSYDGLGRRISAQDLHSAADPKFGVWTYTYDDAGNVITTFNPNQQTVNYSYDDLNRILTENFAGQVGTEVSYVYDSCPRGIGQLCTISNSAVTSSYEYNALGKASKETRIIDAVPYVTLYGYDYAGNIIDIQNPDNSKVKYLYNSAGQVDKVQRKESTDGSFIDVVSNLDYSPAGMVAFQQNTNNTSTINTYDANQMYRLSRKLTTGPTANKLQDLNFTYDAVGNITKTVDSSQTNSSKTTDYTYDDLDRLTSATASGVGSGEGYAKSYAYDPIGNLTTSTEAGDFSYDQTQETYNNPHAPVLIGSYEYSYDRNGNVQKIQNLSLRPVQSGFAEVWLNVWDYNNRLIQSDADKKSTTFAYDPSGQRVKLETSDKGLNIYPTQNYNLENGTAVKHIMLGSDLLATVKGVGTAAQVYFVHTDQLIGSNVVTNNTGAISELLDYYPYGGIRLDEKAGSFSEQKKFTGHELDASTSFTYMNARYYNGVTGKFLSQDPLFWDLPKEYLSDPQQQNSYSYARNNPINKLDADGKLTIIIPGTWYSQSGWLFSKEADSLIRNTANTFHEAPRVYAEDVKFLGWSGGDNKWARAYAASNIQKMIQEHEFYEGEKLNIVSHSHGGNVAAMLSQTLDRKIDNLVTFNTPIRDSYNFDEGNIGSHVNVFSYLDGIQPNGGGFFNFGPLGFGEFGPAGHKINDSEVKNINATDIQTPDTIKAAQKSISTKNPYPFISQLIKNHSSLYPNNEVWGRVRNALK